MCGGKDAMTLQEAAADLRKSLKDDPNVLGVAPFGMGILLTFVRERDDKLATSHQGFQVRQHQSVTVSR